MNPHILRYWILSPARLPIPPLARNANNLQDRAFRFIADKYHYSAHEQGRIRSPNVADNTTQNSAKSKRQRKIQNTYLRRMERGTPTLPPYAARRARTTSIFGEKTTGAVLPCRRRGFTGKQALSRPAGPAGRFLPAPVAYAFASAKRAPPMHAGPSGEEAMAIQVRCPSCGHSFEVADVHRGKTGACPACRKPCVAQESRPPAQLLLNHLKLVRSFWSVSTRCRLCSRILRRHVPTISVKPGLGTG